MQIPIAKCGCDCNACPTYKNNLKTKADRKTTSEGWKKYLNISLSPEKLRTCDGCSIPDNKRKTYYLNCKIRKCTALNNMDNCAYCIQYPCTELLKVHTIQRISTGSEFTSIFKKDITQNEFNRFIEPYCGIKHLDKIREKIKPTEFIDFVKHSINIKFSPNFSVKNSRKKQILDNIYLLLTSICIESNVSFARLKTLETMREQVIKILWTMALYGKLEKNYLELDAKTFMEQKIHGMLNILQTYFEVMRTYGISCEIIPDTTRRWLTPMGGLRKEGWIIRLKYDSATLVELQNYVQRLSSAYKSKGLNIFNTADMSILL